MATWVTSYQVQSQKDSDLDQDLSLTVEYWNPEYLSHIASGADIPLYTVSLTEKQKWLGFEGLCGN